MQSFNRPNLKYELKVKKQASINDEIVTLIKQKFTGQSGIIYCLSRSALLLSPYMHNCSQIVFVKRHGLVLQPDADCRIKSKAVVHSVPASLARRTCLALVPAVV